MGFRDSGEPPPTSLLHQEINYYDSVNVRRRVPSAASVGGMPLLRFLESLDNDQNLVRPRRCFRAIIDAFRAGRPTLSHLRSTYQSGGEETP